MTCLHLIISPPPSLSLHLSLSLPSPHFVSFFTSCSIPPTPIRLQCSVFVHQTVAMSHRVYKRMIVCLLKACMARHVTFKNRTIDDTTIVSFLRDDVICTCLATETGRPTRIHGNDSITTHTPSFNNIYNIIYVHIELQSTHAKQVSVHVSVYLL